MIFDNIGVTDIISNYSWCLSDELSKIISSVNIISDEVMQKFNNTCVTKENYSCPICLCLIHDPVTLNSCFHSFCWKCLATAIQKYSLDNCPLCRTKIFYDNNSIKIDGILSQFLKKHFAIIEDNKEIMNGIINDNNENINNEYFCCDEKEDKLINNLNEDKINFHYKNNNKEEKYTNLYNEGLKIDLLCENKILKKDFQKCEDKMEPFNIYDLINFGDLNKNSLSSVSSNIGDKNEDYCFNIQEENIEESEYYFIENKNTLTYKKCDQLVHGYVNLKEYLSVLNKNDLNIIDEKEKESDISGDEFHNDFTSKMEHKISKIKNEDNYNIINNVIKYTLS